MPRIIVGHDVSAEKVPAIRTLMKGDELTVDLDQVGAAATPTDHDLLVQVVGWYRNPTATSIVFP